MIICALIVTYNRLDKLKTCLESYDKQKRKPDKIIVVDNNSNLETKNFLIKWSLAKSEYEKIILTLDKNYGGSGGFYYGMKKALEIGFDWLWIADDDAYPDDDALFNLENVILSTSYQTICGVVYNSNGIDLNHRRILIEKKYSVKETCVEKENYDKKTFNIDLFSFVGTAISKSVIEECGFPKKEYFIWFDDTEYSYRVRKKFDIICCSNIKIYHDSVEKNEGISWKNYYGERNGLDMYKNHYTKKQFFLKIIRYKLKIIKNYFLNKKYYFILKDAYYDFKINKLGVSNKYKPGIKI